MTFEQWCHSTGMDDARVVDGDMVSMTILKECWDYQEHRIKQLKEQNSKLKGRTRKLRKIENLIHDLMVKEQYE